MRTLNRRRPGAISLRRAVDLMHAGRPLMQMNTRAGIAWFIVPDGEVSTAVAEALLERADVQPQHDGLFPGVSQTFRIRRPTDPSPDASLCTMRAFNMKRENGK